VAVVPLGKLVGMEIKLGEACPFDLGLTLCCGQAFRWNEKGGWWYGVARGRPVKIRQREGVLESENTDASEIRSYFGLEDDLNAILRLVGRDSFAREVTERFRGLRILRQEPWECLVSYICATYKSIPAIRQMIGRLCQMFGEPARFEGEVFYGFPCAERLAKASPGELKSCGLGYRAKYVSGTAKRVSAGEFDLGGLRTMPYEEARSSLLGLPGVGLKVADCVLLFSAGRLEAFPVDVWVKRAILRHYTPQFPKEFVDKAVRCRSPSNTEYQALSAFGRQYFGKYAGYAQEYLYHHERTHNSWK